MKRLKYFSIVFFVAIISTVYSYATWSIIVIDAKTKKIGIAGASCTYSVYGIGAIAPGKGAIVVQAMSNNEARAKGLEMIQAGIEPGEILRALRNPVYEPEEQQYAIVCMNDLKKPVVYTGKLTTSSKGALIAKGISVQGNTLADSAELTAVLKAALAAQKENLPIEEVLMKALEAGAKLGGDKRCGERKAASAFLTVAKPGDNSENPYINLIVLGDNDSINAVEVLRKKLDDSKSQSN